MALGAWIRRHWKVAAALIAGILAGGGIGVAGAASSATTVVSTDWETVTTTHTQRVRPTVTRTDTTTEISTTTETATTTTTTTVTVTVTIGGGCNGANPCPPRSPSGANGTYNCADFDTQQQAQTYFDQVGDIDGLDANHDGIPCESLP